MTDTFTLKQNAKRAASRMIANGSAPSLDFEIVRQGDGFAIKWGKPIAANGDAKPTGVPKTREGTKQEAVIAMMRRPEGASTDEIMEFTGWKIVRGFVAGTVKKKLGLPVTAEKVAGRGTVYRIATPA